MSDTSIGITFAELPKFLEIFPYPSVCGDGCTIRKGMYFSELEIPAIVDAHIRVFVPAVNAGVNGLRSEQELV